MNQVRSNVILKRELADVLRSTLLTNKNLVKHIQNSYSVDIYSSGFQDAIDAIATAYNLDIYLGFGNNGEIYNRVIKGNTNEDNMT